jgi:hypothetical protein
MSELEISALTANFGNWRRERASELPESSAFERYAIELIFKDEDLSDEDISAGLTGGGKVGGIEGFYFFVNRQIFLEEDSNLPGQVLTAHLWIIQAKYESGFSETAVMRIQHFLDDLLTFARPVESLTYYSQKVRDYIRLFRRAYQEIMAQPHEFRMSFAYATRSDQQPHPDVLKRVAALEQRAKDHISSAITDFQFWGAARLFEAFRTPQNRTLRLEILPSMLMDKGKHYSIRMIKSSGG